MSNINMMAVEGLFNHYNTKVKTNPNLYTNSRDRNSAVLVVLPKELLDYANRGAGHSGFGAGARPVGIRRVVGNAASYLKEIFSSKENLKRFIESSECDADEYIAEVRMRHLNSNQPLTKSAKPVMTNAQGGFWSKYTKEDMARLKTASKDQKQLVNDFQTMTLVDFEEKYKLVDSLAA